MISPKITMVKQTMHLSPTLPTIMELLTVVMETTNRSKIKDLKVNRTSLQQKTKPTALHQHLMDSRLSLTALHLMLILPKIKKKTIFITSHRNM